MALVLAVGGVVLPLVAWLALLAVADRMSGGPVGNSSWEQRAASLVTGFEIYAAGGVKGLLFGLGPGLTSQVVNRQTDLEAVWSVLLNYFYDTGLIGAIAASCVASHLLRNWRAVEHRFVYAGMVLAWLVGVTLTTSYDQLLPQWLALGFLIVWPWVVRLPARQALARVPAGAGAIKQIQWYSSVEQPPVRLVGGRTHAC
jgi:hypothetical protein